MKDTSMYWEEEKERDAVWVAADDDGSRDGSEVWW